MRTPREQMRSQWEAALESSASRGIGLGQSPPRWDILWSHFLIRHVELLMRKLQVQRACTFIPLHCKQQLSSKAVHKPQMVLKHRPLDVGKTQVPTNLDPYNHRS